MDHLAIINELASILKQDHPAYTGDPTTNAELFLHTIYDDFPVEAHHLAIDIREHISDFSELTNLSPDRLRWAANRLQYGKFSIHTRGYQPCS